MFDSPAPRLFGLAPGVDFPRALVAGLTARMAGQPPEAMARVTLFVNTRRMQRRIADIFAEGGAALLPRIRLVTDLAGDPRVTALPPPVPPLRRRLELTRLIAGLLDAQPDLAPRSAIYDLADSLAALMDEMQGEGVSPEAIARLDVSDHSAHWKRTRDFLTIIAPFFAADAPPDPEARQRRAVEWLAARWAETPPEGPVIVAGSTGSRGTTARLMQAVAHLPRGAVVLPGFDFDLPPPVWEALDDALTAEDHPQFRFRRLLTALGLTPGDVAEWRRAAPPDPPRNRLLSLSLRPAPVTDQWLTEGQALPDLVEAAAAMTLIEAASPRDEALAIALRLRKAAEDGQVAALITPDRGLTRQVTAALDRWGILPDDSAGRPLALSAPGRLLRHISTLFGRKMSAEALLILLKHPLTHSGADRGEHLRHTRDLELRLRRHGPPFPDGAALRRWADTAPDAGPWAEWLAPLIDAFEPVGARPLTDHVAHHLALAEALAGGPGAADAGELWRREAGEEALAAVTELTAEAPHGGELTPADYADLFAAILNAREVRETMLPHPRIMIWGTLEARVQGAGLVILGGLNDGSWPQSPPPDPWLNRQMRLDSGLLLPERRIGLAAHDYQQAAAAPEVILSRALRDAEAETVPSRWLNRLVNLMQGLPARRGPEALEAMRARGRFWLETARTVDAPLAEAPRAPRPAPRPPVAARPRSLPVTRITTLIRDPYAVYARDILRLYPLNPLLQSPDARLRGSVLHGVMERFARDRTPETRVQARARLLATAREVLAEDVPWPAARALWQARLERVADWFLDFDAEQGGAPLVIEKTGSVPLENLGFTLTARPDRIDALADGRLHILDYKTGSPPSRRMQEQFDKQLLLEAAMAARGGFKDIGPAEVARISYVGLGAAPKIEATEITDGLLETVWAELETLLAGYARRARGYTARRAVFRERFEGDYDHLARYGEWEMSDPPAPEDVGPEDVGPEDVG